jgi:proto-chlorophyllide reductase subunit
MKFLCVPCDSPMTLQSVGPPERGSLSVVYSCPECGYEMAMLTNPFETQLVQSLGVRIGPEKGVAASSVASAGASGSDALLSGDEETEGGVATSRCPFAAMMPAMEGGLESAGQAASTGTDSAAGRASAGDDSRPAEAGEPIPVRWTSAAEARLANIPAFVRPMARIGIERFAREKGFLEVDEQILDAAREFFGM